MVDYKKLIGLFEPLPLNFAEDKQWISVYDVLDALGFEFKEAKITNETAIFLENEGFYIPDEVMDDYR